MFLSYLNFLTYGLIIFLAVIGLCHVFIATLKFVDAIEKKLRTYRLNRSAKSSNS